MLTKKDYCDYDTCVTLKELGFNNLVDWYFNEEKSIVSSLARYRNTYIPRISLYEAQKWLRQEKNIEANASFDKKDDGWIAFIQRLDYPDLYGTDVLSTVYNTYETALNESIKQAINVLKEE